MTPWKKRLNDWSFHTLLILEFNLLYHHKPKLLREKLHPLEVSPHQICCSSFIQEVITSAFLVMWLMHDCYHLNPCNAAQWEDDEVTFTRPRTSWSTLCSCKITFVLIRWIWKYKTEKWWHSVVVFLLNGITWLTLQQLQFFGFVCDLMSLCFSSPAL